MAGNNGFSEAQRVEQRNMFSEISQNFGTAQRGPLGPPGPPGPPEIEGPAGINAQGGAGPGRFIPGDVGFFNPHYDGKSSDTASGTEHAGKDTYFRNIHAFIDRINDVSRVKGAELIQKTPQL